MTEETAPQPPRKKNVKVCRTVKETDVQQAIIFVKEAPFDIRGQGKVTVDDDNYNDRGRAVVGTMSSRVEAASIIRVST